VTGHDDHRDEAEEIGDHHQESDCVLDRPLDAAFMICGSQKPNV
jgi:hypothetical protein